MTIPLKKPAPVAPANMPSLMATAPENMQPPPVEYKGAVRWGMFILGVVFAVLVVIGFVVPIDGGVAADGQIAVEFQKKPVQHPTGGVLSRVLVHEGQIVKQGQVLAELVSADTSAELAMSGLREFGLGVTRSRVMAELAGATQWKLPESVLAKAKANDEFQRIVAVEQQNFDYRLKKHLSDQEALQGTLQRLKHELAATRGTLDSRRRQLKFLEADLARRKTLLNSGFVSEAGYVEYEVKVAEVEAQAQEEEVNIARAERSLHETQSRVIQLDDERRAAASEKLAEVNLELNLSAEKRYAADDKEERLKLRSPADGRVFGVIVHAPGAVLTPGQVLMNIVPDREQRLIIARVPAHKIDGVVAGLPARIRISGRSKEVTLEGKIETVAADKVDDEKSGSGFYTVRVSMDADQLGKSGLVSAEVGMPAQVLLTLERRTFFAYLVRPVKKFFDKALRE